MNPTALLTAARNPTVPLPTSGPYDVQAAGPLAVVLQTNPHAAVHPAIKTYELRLFVRFADAAYAFSRGSIGALLATTPDELSTLMRVKGAQAETMTTPGFVDLMFNERVPALASSVVRHAIGIAINRATLVAGALNSRGGVIQTGPFSAGIPWVGPPATEAISPSASASLLQANGWIAGAYGVRQSGSTQLAFTLAVPDISPLPLVAHEVAVQLAAIGVQVAVSTVPPQTFLTGTLDSGHFQLAIDAWNPVPDPDVSAFWRSNAVPPHGYNMSGGAPDAFLDAALDMLAESPPAPRGSRQPARSRRWSPTMPRLSSCTRRGCRSCSGRRRRSRRCLPSGRSPPGTTTLPHGSRHSPFGGQGARPLIPSAGISPRWWNW